MFTKPVWDIWTKLHQLRLNTDPPSPIQPQAIEAMLNLHGVEGADERLEFFDLIYQLEMHWVKMLVARRSQKKAPKSRK